jgi:hypothetical protein
VFQGEERSVLSRCKPYNWIKLRLWVNLFDCYLKSEIKWEGLHRARKWRHFRYFSIFRLLSLNIKAKRSVKESRDAAKCSDDGPHVTLRPSIDSASQFFSFHLVSQIRRVSSTSSNVQFNSLFRPVAISARELPEKFMRRAKRLPSGGRKSH